MSQSRRNHADSPVLRPAAEIHRSAAASSEWLSFSIAALSSAYAVPAAPNITDDDGARATARSRIGPASAQRWITRGNNAGVTGAFSSVISVTGGRGPTRGAKARNAAAISSTLG